jgi:hypothetical protein
MFRIIAWLLLVALFALVGAYPGLAAFAGSVLLATIGLALHGAALLLAQPAVQILLGLVAGVWLIRTRRLA